MKINPASNPDAFRILKGLDSDNNNKVTASELKALDVDNDGKITENDGLTRNDASKIDSIFQLTKNLTTTDDFNPSVFNLNISDNSEGKLVFDAILGKEDIAKLTKETGTTRITDLDLQKTTKEDRLKILEGITQVDDVDQKNVDSDEFRCVASCGVASALYNEGSEGLSKIGNAILQEYESGWKNNTGNQRGLSPAHDNTTGFKIIHKGTPKYEPVGDRGVIIGKIGGEGQKQYDSFMSLEFLNDKKFDNIRDKIFVELPNGKFISQVDINKVMNSNNEKLKNNLLAQISTNAKVVFVPSGKNPSDTKSSLIEKPQDKNVQQAIQDAVDASNAEKGDMESLKKVMAKLKNNEPLTKEDIAVFQRNLFRAIGGEVNVRNGLGGSSPEALKSFINKYNLNSLLENVDLLTIENGQDADFVHQVISIKTENGTQAIYDPYPRGDVKDGDAVIESGQVSTNQKVVSDYYSIWSK